MTPVETLAKTVRRSIRAFLPTPVEPALLHTVLRQARQAPSGANLQPGHVVQVQGAVRQALSQELLRAWREQYPAQEDYGYFPRPMPLHLRRRQVAAAQALYGALDVERDDKAGRDAQFARNFCFFDAPVALIVTIDSRFGAGGYMDLGMMLYGLMLAAHEHGLASCAIGAMASYPGIIRQHLGLDASQHVVCGVALGYADPAAPVNQTVTERSGLDEFFTVRGA
ncbi:nitroreductase [Curvibacter sp. CHRR-16]|uniref:nitroreductase n=1 Tax=Curvibacter sp. CHRR-16 TaxID=2835872 RepID=UPI001BD99A21|nr:nitroreductase [Curvibacter sp. CHRR-16]